MRLCVMLFLLLPAVSFAQEPSGSASVLTYHNDNSRSGAIAESQLTPSNVKVGRFGKLFTASVDAAVYAQPLYMPGLTINGKTHNVVFIATENNSVYAFDADTPDAALWRVNFNYGPKGVQVGPVTSGDVGCGDLTPIIGITSTPVIDPATNILYAVAKTKEVSNSGTSFYHRLHGVNVLTGQEAFAQVEITASVPGQCGNVQGGKVVFDPLIQHQRSALLLLNRALYIASGSHCDIGPYNGWLVGYNIQSLKPVATFNTTPDDSTGECRGGIWQAGGGPAGDAAGSIYFLTGNGAFNVNAGGHSYGDSAVKMSHNTLGGVTVQDYFTPANQSLLNQEDLDFAGSGATVLLPNQPGANPHLMVAAGKYGNIYLINRDQMGGFNPGGDHVVQTIVQAIGDGSSAYPPPVFLSKTGGGVVYYAASSDSVKAFELTHGMFNPKPVAVAPSAFGYLGGGLSVSGTGSQAIVWALEGTSNPGILHAYNATTLAELYNTNMANGGVDVPGGSVKFSVPTVANGKVYVGTQNAVAVYGLK